MQSTGTKETRMLAYHNDPAVKAKYLGRIRAHQKADELVQGYGYWKNGKGCAVGCTIHGSTHMDYEKELGIPVMLARLEDQIFEGLPVADAKKWPTKFLNAVKPGQDLSLVGWKFLHWLLTEHIKVEGEGKIFDDVRFAIKQCADVLVPLKDGGQVNKDAARAAYAARAAAYAAADAAYAAYAAYAAAYAADAARAAYAAYAARAAAYAAADAAYAAYAADAARAAYAAARAAYAAAYAADAAYAAYAAADAADAAYAARAAYAAYAARAAAYKQMAVKLIELIKETK